MPAAGEAQGAAWCVIHAIPECEVEVVLLLHWKSAVQGRENLAGMLEINSRERARAQDMDSRNREKTRADAVPADIQQVNRKMLRIDPMVAEGIPRKLARGTVFPVHRERGFQWFGQDRSHIGRCLGEFFIQTILGLFDLPQMPLLGVAQGFLFEARANSRFKQRRVERLWQIILRARLDTPNHAVQFI